MADIKKFKELFTAVGISYSESRMTSADAQDLARMCSEPSAAKSAKYILVGNTLFHFDFRGRCIGVESTNFEAREDNTQEEVNGSGSAEHISKETQQEGAEDNQE